VPHPSELRLGTRGSQLALWQAEAVAARITAAGGAPCRIVVIKTSGDRLQDAPLAEVGGKRLFVKEIEDALLQHTIDLAVHSSKDMPARLPDGLVIGGVLPRDDPRDAVVLPVLPVRLKADPTIGGLKADATVATIDDLVRRLGQSPSIGTGSVRRIAQLSRVFAGARFAAIRGNLDTRLRKLDAGAHDALVLAAAGLRRLGFGARISFALPVAACVPAPGQGIVAVEVREDDDEVRQLVNRIADPSAAAALAAERALVDALGGGCQTPIGALAAAIAPDRIELVAIVAALDGSRVVRGSQCGSQHDAASIGTQLGAKLMADGAADILAEVRGTQGAVQGIQP
jgi:hydroxymethylbilane synthase